MSSCMPKIKTSTNSSLDNPASAANILSGLQAIDGTGSVITGTMPNRGKWDLTTSFAGAGYVSSVTTPSASQITFNQSIAGVTGTGHVGDVLMTGLFSVASSTFLSTASEHTWGTCSLSAYTTRQTCEAASGDWTPSDPPTGYREIPLVASDTTQAIVSVSAARPNVDCGTTGSITARIANCLSLNTTRAVWNSGSATYPKYGAWKLVSRIGASIEVWRDERTLLLWTYLPSGATTSNNWCRRTGNTELQTGGFDCRANSGTSCGGSACQPASPQSACAEAAGLSSSVTGENWATGTYSAYKGAMGKNSLAVTGAAVRWRSLTLEDYFVALRNGLIYVSPGASAEIQMATIQSNGNAYALFYGNGTYGYTGDITAGNESMSVSRATYCVGR